MKKVICLLLLLSLCFGSQVTVKIPKGASTSDIAKILKHDKYIKSEFMFNLVAKIFNKEHRFLPGKLTINSKLTYLGIINQLQDIKNIQVAKVTIPEGFTLLQIDDLLVKKGLLEKNVFYNFTTDRNKFIPLLKDIPELYNEPNLTKLEGFLFPDTYFFPYDITAEEIAYTMLNVFKNKVMLIYGESKEKGTIPKKRGKTINFYNLITLASIVEGEAVAAEERTKIAGVFINRLNSYMPLGSCPTIHYARALDGLPKVIDLSYNDTRIKSDYNTYIHGGLPPSPIGNPGLASIKATLNPEKHYFYYFVSNKDGTHHFSKTNSEHNQWKWKYYKK